MPMKKIVFATASLALFGSMYVVPAFAQVIPLPSERGGVSVSLTSPTSIDAIVGTLKDGAFDAATVQASFTVNGQTIQDFMTITPNASDVRSKWSDGRKSLIAQLTKDGFFAKNAKSASVNSVLDDSTTFTIKSITIYGEKQSILNTAGKFTGKHSDFRDASANSAGASAAAKSSSASQPVSPLNGQIRALAVANNPYYLLLPISGSVSTGLFTAHGVTNPTRGVVNYMGWNSNGFASDQTYEHDFFLSAAGGTYFARSFSSPATGCIPVTVYAATSWPSSSYPYLDSDLESDFACSNGANSNGNIAYSIGAGQANAINAGVTHFTAILMANGDATTDISIVQGQIGYQNPVGCHSPLCSFAYGYSLIKPPYTTETTHYNFIKNVVVPSSKSWTNVGYTPDTPQAVSVSNPTVSGLRLNFVDVTWDETNISAERSVGSSGPWTVFNFGILNAGNAPGNWYWDNTGLSSHTTYCYRMRSMNAHGNSAYSPTACGTTQ